MTAAEFLRKLKRLAEAKGLPLRIEGSRGKGGHQTVYLGTQGRTIISRHGKKDLTTGAVHGMLRQLGLTIQDIEE